MKKAEILNLYVDDDRRTLIVYERARDGVSMRRERAEYVTFHERADFTAAQLQELRNFQAVRGMRDEGAWLRISWTDDGGRKAGRRFMRDNGIDVYEGDVDPELLYLVESGAPIAKPRRCYLDIETDSDVPLSRKEDMRIISWAVVDHDTGEVSRMLLERDDDASERTLLLELVRVLSAYQQICVWEGDWAGGEFDSFVVPSRMAQRGIVDVDPRKWIWTNQLAVWKKHSSAESGAEGSFKLDVIAHEQLGDGKERVPQFVIDRFGEAACRGGLGRLIRPLYDAGGRFRDLILEYNEKDTALLRRLELEKRFLELQGALASVCGLTHEDRSMQPTRLMDGYMLRLGRKVGRRFATRERFEAEDAPKKFRGAIVFPPKSVPNLKPKIELGEELWTAEQAAEWRRENGFKNGILHNVHVCDFSGMYPNIMRTFNLGVEVLAGWAKRPEDLKPDQCMSPGTGLVTSTLVRALITNAFEDLAKQRKHWQDLAASLPPGTPDWINAMAMSNAFKVAMNAFYGAGGTPNSRFYNRDVSEATTQNAVHFLKLAASSAQARRMVLAYGDSVTGDRTVVVKDPRGLVRIMPIETLWEHHASTEHETVRGKEVTSPIGWRALTEKGWMPLRHVIKHRVRKSIHEITTKHGQTAVTRDHGIMVDGEAITPSKFVSRGRSFQQVDAQREMPIERIDILDFIGDMIFRQEGRRGPRHLRFVPEDPEDYGDGAWIVLDGMQVQGDKQRFRRFYREGTPERDALMRLVGAYVSDGSASIMGLTTSRWMLSFCKSDLGVQQRVIADLRAISDAHFWGPAWTETVFVVRSGAVTPTCFFAALCGWKSKAKRLPSFAFHASDRDYACLRQALAEGDGHVEASGALVYTTISQELAAGVSYVLAQHGERHSFSFRESKRAWKIRTRKGAERTRRYSIKHGVDVSYEGDVYDLSVDGAHTFVDGIGRVLLHNTDSTFLCGPTIEGFSKFIAWLNGTRFPAEVTRHHAKENHIKIAFEKSYSHCVMVTKKRYVAKYLHYKFSTTCGLCTVGKNKNPGSVDIRTLRCRDCGHQYEEIPPFLGKPEIKGLAFKRGDVYPLARIMQARIIDLLVGGVKVKDAGGHDVPANPGIPTPTEDLHVYRQVVEEFRDKAITGRLELEEVMMAKGLSEALRSYAKEGAPVHVKVARTLQDRGIKISKGMRIEYVIADAGVSPQVAVPAEDFTGECDRYHLWEQTWTPTKELLQAAFPDENWDEWDVSRPPRPRKQRAGKKGGASDEQLGLALAAPLTKESRIRAEDEIAVPAYRASALRIEIPERAGVAGIELVKAALAANPGARTVALVIRLRSGGEALVKTTVRVSPGPKLKADVQAAIAASEIAEVCDRREESRDSSAP